MQIIWGEDDPAISLSTLGRSIREATGVESITTVSSRHFLQEEYPKVIADQVREIGS